MIVMGVDPGTAATGVGILSYRDGRFDLLHAQCIVTEPSDSQEQRLEALYEGVSALIRSFAPDWLALERIFFNANSKTAMAISQSRGVILLAATQQKVRVSEYTPLEVKVAVAGYGKADKRQVQSMVSKLLGLDEPLKPDDVSDAVAVAICHINSCRMLELKNVR